jgi:hypothetical protein
MNLAQYDSPSLFAPLQQFLQWLAHAPQQVEIKRQSIHSRPHGGLLRQHENFAKLIKFESNKPTRLTANKPLRIVRILEADHAPANVGRMVISGRMSDVCAELDRLAAREAGRQ